LRESLQLPGPGPQATGFGPCVVAGCGIRHDAKGPQTLAFSFDRGDRI
jgi:hypothetical protein